MDEAKSNDATSRRQRLVACSICRKCPVPCPNIKIAEVQLMTNEQQEHLATFAQIWNGHMVLS